MDFQLPTLLDRVIDVRQVGQFIPADPIDPGTRFAEKHRGGNRRLWR
jgi:hypothetical protein